MGSIYGDAQASDVRVGKTFTSSSGVKLEGTMKSGKVTQGTITGAGTNAVTIDTGLSDVSKLIIFRGGGATESGILTLTYVDGKTTAVGISYGQYLSTVSYSVGEVVVEGGTVTYTPKDGNTTSNLMEGKEYTWIAIE